MLSIVARNGFVAGCPPHRRWNKREAPSRAATTCVKTPACGCCTGAVWPRGVALGVGIGVFPLPQQIPAIMLRLWRCGPMWWQPLCATGLTNPFTMAPIWGLSAHVGAYVVQQKVTTTPSPAMARCLLEAGDVLGSSPAGGFSHRRRRAGAVSLRLCVLGLGRAHQTRTAAAPAAC
ncbi:DUF2062 domain-containing protein [Methyloversatilis sp.]|uniref:DUF2062 domain-containing protein n=1 Tax=Methyloversatilis sp. TaxID=2569862 RepID=UPI003525C1D2